MPTSVVNFDGLSAEAAEKLAGGLAAAVRARINDVGALAKEFDQFPAETALRLREIMLKLAEGGGGGCGIGCC